MTSPLNEHRFAPGRRDDDVSRSRLGSGWQRAAGTDQ